MTRWVFAACLLNTFSCSEPTQKSEKKDPNEAWFKGTLPEGSSQKRNIDVLGSMSPRDIQVYMIQLTKDLDVSCETCHEDDDNMKNIVHYGSVSRSMIHLSRTFNVECRYCHESLSTLNEKGKVSLTMKTNYSDKLEVPCLYCHEKKTAFKLNRVGQKVKKQEARLKEKSSDTSGRGSEPLKK